MPGGTFTVSASETFSNVLLMASGPRLRFGTDEQDVSKAGEKKWELTCAVTFRAENGMRAQSEVIQLTCTGGAADPAASIAPGTPVELLGFRVGISTPEQRTNERGSRIVGGKPWFQCSGVRPASPGSNGRPLAAAGAKSE